MSFSPSQIRYPEFFRTFFDNSSTPGTYLEVNNITYGDLICWAINITNSDTVAHTVRFASTASDQTLMYEASVPAGAGHNGVAPVQVLTTWMPSGLNYLVLGKENGPDIWATVGEAIASGKLVCISIHAGYV